MPIPKWLTQSLDESGADKISEAVKRAESQTTAEIVPIVVSGSINTGHVSWLLFLIAIPIGWALIPHGWEGEIATVVAAALFAWIFHRFAFVQRILTPNADEVSSVNRRALLEFYLANLRGTTGRTGVLIFISMLERRAVILADDAVSSKFPPETWDEILKAMLVQVKKGNFADGMIEAVDLLGKRLSEKLPAAAHNVNQLPNTLIIKE